MSNMYFLKGVGIGMIAGATAALVAMPKKKASKNTAGRALKSIGEIIEGITETITH